MAALSRIKPLAILASGFLLLHCGSSDSERAVATNIALFGGDHQSAPPSQPLAQPIVVLVTDKNGGPVPGALVTFAATGGGGSIAVPEASTDAAGKATALWTVGATLGIENNTATASSSELAGSPVSFTASVVEGSSILGNVTVSGASLTSLLSGASASMSRPFSAALRAAGEGAHAIPPMGTRAMHRPEYAPDELLVRFRGSEVSAPATGMRAFQVRSTALAVSRNIRSRLSAGQASRAFRVTGVSPVLLTARVRVSPGMSLDSVAQILRRDPAVLHVARSRLLWAHGTAARPLSGTTIPNDPNFPNASWHYDMLDLPHAWNITTGSSNVIVAVLDNGVRFDHPALTANLRNDGYDFVSAGVASGICHNLPIDNADDGDGYDNNPTIPISFTEDFNNNCLDSTSPDEFGGHGIHTTGTIGAVGNDGIGVTGINWQVGIRPVRVLGVANGSDFDVAQGILYAAGLPADDGNGGVLAPPAEGANIINMSLGGGCTFGTHPDPGIDVLRDAVVAASDPGLAHGGTLVVASAGNDGTSTPSCPAAYPEVISVSAVGPSGQIASYSSRGATIDIAAPGGETQAPDATFWVFSTTCDFRSDPCLPNYSRLPGTSMAAPHVAGVAALLVAAEPGLTAANLRTRLLSFASPAGDANLYGAGIVNAENSLTQTIGPTRSLRVRLYNATTLASVAEQDAPGGAFSFSSLADGTYFVFAGEDESADGVLGLPDRPWGGFSVTSQPSALTVSATQGGVANFNVGRPIELEDNATPANASRLLLGGYTSGSLSPGDAADYFRITIPTTGQYTFETSGFSGNFCSYALDVNTSMDVFGSDGVSAVAGVTVLNDIDSAGNNFCSRASGSFTAGTYIIRITAGAFFDSPGKHQGRYVLQARSGS